jgi:ammonium transporter, Amt family
VGQTSDIFKAAVNDGFAWSTLMLSFQLVIGVAAITAARVRAKHHARALNTQICLFAVMALSTYLLGWWIRQLFAGGPGIVGIDGAALSAAWPWSELMGPWLLANGIEGPGPDLLHHLVASWLVAALLALATAERMQATALYVLAVLAGSVCSSISAAWMWSPAGWLVQLTGFHDAFGAASVHAVAGGFALGVLQVVGRRRAFEEREGIIAASSVPTPWLASLGTLFLIGGLIAFSAGKLTLLATGTDGSTLLSAVDAYGTATPIFAVTGNLLLAVAAGLMVGHIELKGQPTGTLAGGLAGLIAVSAGADRYHPLQVFLLAALVSWLSLRLGRRLRERHGIDDAAGVISIHGFAAVAGLIAAGIMLWTLPSTSAPGAAIINPFGNAAGAVLAFVILGQLPGYAAARFISFLGALRIPVSIELAGADLMLDVDAANQIRSALTREKAAAGDLGPFHS